MGQQQSSQEDLIIQRKKQRELDMQEQDDENIDPYGYKLRINEFERDRQYEDFENQIYNLQAQGSNLEHENKLIISNLKGLQFRSEIYQSAIDIQDSVSIKYDRLEEEAKQRQIEAELINKASLANQALQENQTNQQGDVELEIDDH